MGIFSEIWSSISRNRFRTAMTGFAVAWGIFILVVLLGASNGLQNGIQDTYGNRLTNAVDIWAGWTSMPYQGLKADRPLYFTNREAQLIRELPEVDLFSRVVNKNGVTANYGAQYASVTLKGVENDYQPIFRKTVYRGRFLDNRDDAEHAKVCVIDKRCTEELGTEDLVGRYLQLGDISFLVVGICENGDRWEGATVHIPISTHQIIFSPDRHFDHMSLTIKEEYAASTKVEKKGGMAKPWERESSAFETKVRETLAPYMQFDKQDNRAVGVWSQQERVSETNNVMYAIRLFVLIIGICTLISGAVGVSNIMLVSVRERTKEFGIRKAIGAPPRTILLTVVGESILITAIFGYIGMFVGIGIMEAVNRFLPEGDYPFRNPTVDIPVVATATFILIVVGVIAGAIPALRAMHIKPIEALNYEK